LLRQYVTPAAAVASVVTAKLTYSIAQALVILAGFALAFARLEVAAPVSLALIAAFALTVLGVGAFFVLQRRGLFGTSAAVLARLGAPGSWMQAVSGATAGIDERVRDFHRVGRWDFSLSVLVQVAGFGIAVAQVYLLLRWLGIEADAVTCLAIESFSLVIQFALFLVPASIGVQEGGKVVIFAALGLPATAGLGVGVAYRLNQLAEIALGLAVFAILQWRRQASRGDQLETEAARPLAAAHEREKGAGLRPTPFSLRKPGCFSSADFTARRVTPHVES
jgi:hypothetical protein